MVKNKVDEIDLYLAKYFNETSIIKSIGNFNIKELVNSLLESNKFDAPDRYYIKEKDIFIFEHFQIDSSKHTKNGSSSQIAENNEEKEIQQYSKNNKNKSFSLSGSLKIDNSAKYYMDTLSKSFKKHYDHIDLYKKRIIQEEKLKFGDFSFKIVFIIEDNSILGTFRKDNADLVFPYLVKDFMDQIRKYGKIDFLICSNHFGDVYYSHIISKDAFYSNIDNEYNLSDVGIYNTQPQYIYFEQAIKK